MRGKNFYGYHITNKPKELSLQITAKVLLLYYSFHAYKILGKQFNEAVWGDEKMQKLINPF
ncbi:MAG: hypothetical protein ABI683_05355 [Ginsengibacter sp.]